MMVLVVTHLSALASGVLLGAAALHWMRDRRRAERPHGEAVRIVPGVAGLAAGDAPEHVARQVGA